MFHLSNIFLEVVNMPFILLASIDLSCLQSHLLYLMQEGCRGKTGVYLPKEATIVKIFTFRLEQITPHKKDESRENSKKVQAMV